MTAPAETLRRAAAVLRTVDAADGCLGREENRALMQLTGEQIARADMHPDVRAALADWLKRAARHYDAGFLCCDHGPDSCSEIVAPALATARAVLGEGEPS